METLFICLLKSSGLLAAFYLSYHFLVRNETFFTSNRWFLLSGLITSVVLPLVSIKKIIYVESPKINVTDLASYTQQLSTPIQNNVPTAEAFDWIQLVWMSYLVIASILFVKIILNFLSLYRMLYKQPILKTEQFKIINLNKNIAPFSFFNYIVYNANLYSTVDLENIMLHEKVHCQEKHSLDILIAKLFCSLFWFNPFVWLYKKAITQNLEYIADQKAIKYSEDKKFYQLALLKVVSNQNCLPITNNFYQSLIKKRIIMLNKNQSPKRNSWKYSLVIPVLISFVLLFQVSTVAQELIIKNKNQSFKNGSKVKMSKNSSDEEIAPLYTNNTESTSTIVPTKINFSPHKNDKGEIISYTLIDDYDKISTKTTEKSQTKTIVSKEQNNNSNIVDTLVYDGKEYPMEVKNKTIKNGKIYPVYSIAKTTKSVFSETQDSNTINNDTIIIQNTGKKRILLVKGKIIEGGDDYNEDELIISKDGSLTFLPQKENKKSKNKNTKTEMTIKF